MIGGEGEDRYFSSFYFDSITKVENIKYRSENSHVKLFGGLFP